MKRDPWLTVTATVALALLAIGAAWFWRTRGSTAPSPVVGPPPVSRRQLPSRERIHPFPPPVPLVEDAKRASATWLEGRVVRRGVPVEGASVQVQGDVHGAQVKSGVGGIFSFTGVRPGRYFLAATLENEASRLTGPYWLGAGEEVSDVVLELEPGAVVSGLVRDAVTREPLAKASVRSSSGLVVTNAAGRFTLGPLPLGRTWMEATAPRHLSRIEWLIVDAAREVSGFELYLPPSATLKGRVVRGPVPVSGATVTAEPTQLRAAVGLARSAITAADGRFSLEVEPGTVRPVAAGPRGGRIVGTPVAIAAGADSAEVTLDLASGAVVRGNLVVNGQPGGGVEVRILDALAQRLAGMTTTTAAGEFQLEDVAPGSYLVQLQRGTLWAQRGPYEALAKGSLWQVELEEEAALTGRVLPAAPGVSVQWRSSAWAGDTVAFTSTDEKGEFRFESVPKGELWVDAEGEAGAAQARAQAGSPVTLTLARSRLVGTARSDRGHVLTDFTLRVIDPTGRPPFQTTILSASGAFEVPVPPGTYEVSATAPGHEPPAHPARVVITSGRDASVHLVLQAASALEGVVLHAETRAPLTGVEVTLTRPSAGRSELSSAVTSGEGRFAFGTRPRRGSLRVQKVGFRPLWAPLHKLPRDGARVELLLTPGGDPSGPPPPYEGVGMQLSDVRGRVVVDSLFEGGSAEGAGVAPGDIVVAVDGQSVEGLALPGVVSRIIGPAGTVVVLGLQRGNERLEAAIRRKRIQF